MQILCVSNLLICEICGCSRDLQCNRKENKYETLETTNTIYFVKINKYFGQNISTLKYIASYSFWK